MPKINQEEYEGEETEVKKNIEWLKNEVIDQNLINKDGYIYAGNLTRLLDQLDEPEVLSQEWIDENKTSIDRKLDGTPIYKVREELLQNILVPKREEPETVADVVTTFWKSYERLKEVMSMEVEELEE